MKESETKKLLSMIRAQYQHRFITDDMTFLVWHGLLNEPPELPTEAVYQAAMTWMRDHEWPPQVRDLRDIIASQVCGIPTAEEAWTHLQRWLKAGYPGIPDSRPPLPDLTAQVCRDLGGTSMIRNAEKPDQMRARFVAVYEKARREQMQVADVATSWTAIGAPQRKAIA